MPSSFAYEPVLSSQATSALIGLSKPKQRKITTLLLQLAAHPNQSGDYSTREETGRDVQHLQLGDFLVSFWADDAVRELRVVDISRLI